METPQLPRYSNPRGLLRSHFAQQRTEFYPTIEQQQTARHPASEWQQTKQHPVIEQQQTMRHPAIAPRWLASRQPSMSEQPSGTGQPPVSEQPTAAELPATRKRRWSRLIVIVVIAALALMIFLIWHSSTPATVSPSVVQQSQGSAIASTPGTGSATAATSPTDDGSIKVYVAGAVKHPGVYTLNANARVYQLLQAAGGPLSNANLVALNLAAKLTDGQEVYVLAIGETPPSYVGGVPGTSSSASGSSGSGTATVAPGQLVNINTASADQMRQGLHVSSTTAQKIIDYRTQNGPYTSVDKLLQVISKSIYDRIKGMVTVS